MKGTHFNFANLSHSRFEPIQLPPLRHFYNSQGLETLRFRITAYALYTLRNKARNSGLRPVERQITLAIEREKNRNRGWMERTFYFIFFDITFRYGMSPNRPLLIILVLIVLFSLPYIIALTVSPNDQTGIWRFWPEDVILREGALPQYEKITAVGLAIFGWAIYFSLLSAFHIGWRDFNIGNWIARISPVEYVLRATGWPKIFSGIQSLLSVYLLALWVLGSFGRPFG